MPIPGPHVHRQLISAYNDAAAQLERVRAEMGQVEGQRDRLEDARDQSLTRLAEHYLPELTPEAIQETWHEVRTSMSEILLRKQNHARELTDDLDADNHLRAGQEQGLSQLNERLDEAEKRQNEVAGQVEADLQANSEFIALSDRAAMAEAALERAEANLDQVSQDAVKKLPSYDECKLFNYLKDRNFGTSEYKPRGFTRRMDRMIGKMVDYTQSKRNYDFLRDTPDTMRKIIAEDRAALDTVLDELQRHRDEAAEKFGLMAQVKAVEAIQAERQSALAELATTSQRVEAHQVGLNDLENPRGEYYREAIELFRGMLSRTDTSELRQQARRTPEITDDQIVASLRGIESEIDTTFKVADRHQDRLRTGQDIHQAVGRLIQRFRASGFDVPRCQFADVLDVAGLLDRVRDQSDVDEVWYAIRRSQSWGPTTMDKITNVATHPMTQVLVNAMAHAAAGAMSEHARRAGHRSTRRRW